MANERIPSLIDAGQPCFSFEFFPPKDAQGALALWETIRDLEPYHPSFVSVTYGAGGSTRDTTVEITGRIARETTMVPLGHLTCVGHTRAELRRTLHAYAGAGVRNVLALRGDPPGGPGTPWLATPGGLSHASELVALTRDAGDFSVGVAAFPQGHREARSLAEDIAVLLEKQRAGAEFAITDMFFRCEDYFSLTERARAAGVEIPILAGIMPITSLPQIIRMAELSGREVPAEVVSRVARHEGDPAAVRAAGITIAAEMCRTLVDHDVPGLHFYTLNRSRATLEIFRHLNITV